MVVGSVRLRHHDLDKSVNVWDVLPLLGDSSQTLACHQGLTVTRREGTTSALVLRGKGEHPSSPQLTELNQSKTIGGAEEQGWAQVGIYGPDFHGFPERKQETLAVQS